jgi:hypothetical protein
MGQQISFGMVRESDKKLVFNFPWVDKFEEPWGKNLTVKCRKCFHGQTLDLDAKRQLGERPFFWVLNYEPAAGDLELSPAVHNDNKA